MRLNNKSSAAKPISDRRIRILQKVSTGVFLFVVSVSILKFGLNPQALAAEKPVAKQSTSQTVSKKWPETAVYLPLDQLDAIMSRCYPGANMTL